MIELLPMTEAQFATYLAGAVRSYADAHRKAGDVHPDDAHSRAQADYDELLPAGLRSPNQHLYALAHDTLGTIGMIWFEFRDRNGMKCAFLYDFEIREDLRGQGHGRRVLELFEEKLRGLGAEHVRLNVFGHNHAARALYEKMGYVITGIGMKKRLASGLP